MKVKEKVVIETYENQIASLSKPDDMDKLDCLDLLTNATIQYYKACRGITSYNEAIKKLGLELLNAAARRGYY